MNSLMHRRRRSRQRGMVLITSLLLLLVATILALSMFRSFGTQERIAGNLREKERALHAAESAQQFAEYWLVGPNATSPVVCNSAVPASVGQVCVGPALDYTSIPIPWTIGVNYTPPNMNVTLTAGSGTNSNGTYFNNPMFSITDLGSSALGEVYQIDGLGYGATADAVAVVESTYVIIPAATSPDK
jgi:type IV pilus assembly protein PilX